MCMCARVCVWTVGWLVTRGYRRGGWMDDLMATTMTSAVIGPRSGHTECTHSPTQPLAHPLTHSLSPFPVRHSLIHAGEFNASEW